MRSLSEPERTLKLAIVSTPIGNLGDISSRALQTLKEVDYILCEDTRHTQKLKTHFGLTAELMSFHEHNERSRIPEILVLMEQGKTFALVSDAGAPLISDPGYVLVKELIEAGIEFTYIPGPSAIVAALILSGFPAVPFSFHGFLPVAKGARTAALQQLAKIENQTLIFFESPQRVISLVREIGEILGDHEVAICRELTKLHEEVWRGRCSQLLVEMAQKKMQGEFTVVVAPGVAERVEMSDETIRTRFQQLLSEGMSRKEALKKLTKESGRSRNDLYKLLLQ